MKRMMMILFSSAMILSVAASPSNAKGCLKGAVVGGVAGHYAGHHGFLGAAAGCLVGRHHAAEQREREKEKARQQGAVTDTSSNPGSH